MTSEKIALGSKAAVSAVADDDVIQDFNLEQLSSPNQIPRHLDVGFTGISRS
jgi:hypothetical protein